MTPTMKNDMTLSVLGRLKQRGMPSADPENLLDESAKDLDPNEPGISEEEKKKRIELMREKDGEMGVPDGSQQVTPALMPRK